MGASAVKAAMHFFQISGIGNFSDKLGVIDMIKLFKFFRRDESGAAAAEYALILAVVGGGIAVAATLLGTNIAAVITRIAGLIV